MMKHKWYLWWLLIKISFKFSVGGFVFTADDGYNLGAKTAGMAHILGWKYDGSQQVFYSEQALYPGVTHDSNYPSQSTWPTI